MGRRTGGDLAESAGATRSRPTGELTVDRPTGVAGYRVDVRLAGHNRRGIRWLASRASAALTLGLHSLGIFHGEGVVEAVATQHSPASAATVLAAVVFCDVAWRLAGAGRPESRRALGIRRRPPPSPYLLDREKAFVPVADTAVQLRYGQYVRVPGPPRRSDARRAGLDTRRCRSLPGKR